MTVETRDQKPDLLGLVARGDVAALAEALEAGADANARDRWGAPALSRAAGRGDLDCVRLLLDRGADPSLTSDAGNSALMIAAARGHLDVMRALLEAGADPEAKNHWGFDAREWAKWAKDPAEARSVLVSYGAKT